MDTLDENRTRGRLVTIVLLGILGAAGSVSLLLTQKWGAGASSDSIGYIAGARSLAEGNGYARMIGTDEPVAITQWPPLFSAVLALGALFGLDPLDGSLWLNSVLFGVNIFLAGLAVHLQNRRARWTPVVASLGIGTAFNILATHSMAWTEPLFLTCAIVGAMCLVGSVKRDSRVLFVLAAVAFSAATMTRYAGIALVMGACIYILIGRGRPFKRRLLASVAFGVLAGGPIVLWMIRNMAVGGSMAYHTEVMWHPITLDQLGIAVSKIRGWFYGKSFSRWLNISRLGSLGVGVGLLVWFVIADYRKGRGEKPSEPGRYSLAKLLGILIVTYIGFLVFAISFVATNILFTNRILTPVYFLGVILVIALVGPHVHFGRRAVWVRLLIVALVLAFTTGSVFYCLPQYRKHLRGQVYTSEPWQTRPIVKFVRELPDETVIYSNEHQFLYLLTQKQTYKLPSRYHPASLIANENYAQEIATIRRKCRARKGGLLIYFRGGYPRPHLATEKELVEALRPVKVLVANTGVSVYQSLPLGKGE